MKTLTAEIFAPGTWNGMPFQRDDLEKIVTSFKQLKDIHKVPLKFGHNDDQPITDGQPALGWVEDVFIDTGKDGKTKLMARFADIPRVVFDAIKKKLYRKVSIELDMDVKHHRGRFDYVLSGVALLGADLPAVNVLADLTAYMKRSSMVASRTAQFTAISTNQEGTNVSEELKAQLAEMREKMDGLMSANADLKAQNAQFTAKEEERKEAEAKAKVTDARTKFTSMLDQAVKDDKILPAQREAFSKVLRLDDDAAVVALTDETVNALIDSVEGPGKKFSRDSSQSKGQSRTDTDPGQSITQKAREIQNTTPGMSFARALDRAMAADPDLARAHLTESACKED